MSGLALLQLLPKRIDELTDSDVAMVIDAFQAHYKTRALLSPELRGAAMALLKDHDINVVSDMIQSPQAVGELVELFKAAPPSVEDEAERQYVAMCKSCHKFSLVDVTSKFEQCNHCDELQP